MPSSFGAASPEAVVGMPAKLVEAEDIDEASESLPPVMLPIRVDAVELDLFFFGSGGSTFPGSSVRSLLYRRLKSPYRRPTKRSGSPLRLTRSRNS